MPLFALVGIAGLLGLMVGAVVARSPARDPSAPRVKVSRLRSIVDRHPRLRAYLLRRADRSAATGLALTSAVLILIAAVTVIGVLAAMARSQEGLVRYDVSVAEWAMQHASGSATRVLRMITQFGGANVVIPLAIAVAVMESIRLRTRAVWSFLILVVGGQFLVANTIKFFVDRARPTLAPLTGFSGASFPSGHATAAAATYCAFALLIGTRRNLIIRAIASGSAVSIGVLIAGSRVLLGVHWLTDVIGGLVLGWAWFALWSLAFGGRYLHFGAPTEAAAVIAAQASKPTTPAGPNSEPAFSSAGAVSTPTAARPGRS
jgi:undecaprenyl-diphosphatase